MKDLFKVTCMNKKLVNDHFDKDFFCYNSRLGIEEHILDTNAGKQLTLAATDV